MILCDHREVETKSNSNDKEMLPLEDASDDDVEYPIKGELFMIR